MVVPRVEVPGGSHDALVVFDDAAVDVAVELPLHLLGLVLQLTRALEAGFDLLLELVPKRVVDGGASD